MRNTQQATYGILSNSPQRILLTSVICLLLVLWGIVYLPGISGPWIFDDYGNLLQNTYIRIESLNAQDLHRAAYSLQAGPLSRPISMFSFALNYYFAGSFSHTTPFKLTNLVIHVINGLLVFWLSRLIFERLAQINPGSFRQSDRNAFTATLLAGALALLWLIHPIQITTVLYVVQRMTALSALFTLLALIFYLKGRLRLISGRNNGIWLIILGLIGFGSLGMLSKENAALLPVFVLLLEIVLFADKKPWCLWHRLSGRTKRLLYGGLTVLAIVCLILAINYALPGYYNRQFTMAERVLTETRVLFFYIFLILVPRIDQFSHQHDDITISQSLVDPWTTLSSLIGIFILLGLAIIRCKKSPLLSLGILWFFIGHLLESTILPLEIAHEHRNYLASLGVLFVIIYFIQQAARNLSMQKTMGFLLVIALIFSGITCLRASQWSDPNTFYRYEVEHHPASARIQAGMSLLYESQGQYNEAMVAARKAWELAPYDTGFLLSMHHLAARQGKNLSAEEEAETLRRLATEPLTPTTYLALENIASCLQTSCKSLQIPMETWMNAILNERTASADKSFYYYLLGISLAGQGRIHEAIDVFRKSYELDPLYLHPLLNLAKIFIDLKQVDVAERVIAELHKANRNNPHPRDREIQKLEADLRQVKTDMTATLEQNRLVKTTPATKAK
jgi:protein O-mannosyl-transferase